MTRTTRRTSASFTLMVQRRLESDFHQLNHKATNMTQNLKKMNHRESFIANMLNTDSKFNHIHNHQSLIVNSYPKLEFNEFSSQLVPEWSEILLIHELSNDCRFGCSDELFAATAPWFSASRKLPSCWAIVLCSPSLKYPCVLYQIFACVGYRSLAGLSFAQINFEITNWNHSANQFE